MSGARWTRRRRPMTANTTFMKPAKARIFQRAQKPQGMLMQPRDYAILHAVYRYRRLTREQIERLLFLEHTLAVNDVRIAFEQGAERRGYRIEAWLDESTLKRWWLKNAPAGESGGSHVIPDAYILLNLGQQQTHLFLELDRATMSGQRWKRRIAGYTEFLKSERLVEQFQLKSSPRIVTVTTSEQRLANLCEATRQVLSTDQ